MAEVEVKAVSKFARISPLKVRRIVGTIKGKPVEDGLNTLKLMPQKSAKLLEKVVRSALANAEQKPSIDVDTLLIANVTADKGPMLKRFKARARGRGTRILKRTAHITVTLSEATV